MFQNYLKVAFKNLLRFKFVSIINLIGLTTGFAVCGMIYFFVKHELSYDQFHTKAANLYRLTTETKYPGTTPRIVGSSAAPMAPHLQRQFGEVENFVRLIPQEKNLIYKYNNKETSIENAFAVDSTFFEIFDFQLLQGNKKTALSAPNNMLISRQLADQLFENENPLGKIITQTFPMYSGQDTTVSYVVTGILDKVPQHSHLQFDALFNIQYSLPGDWGGQEWHGLVGSTYLLFRSPLANTSALEARIAASLKNVMGASESIRLHLQPFTGIHLDSVNVDDDTNNFQKFDRQYIYIFSIIAFIVLAIAGVNFTNLSTAIANKRAKEIGIRKTIGANKTAIVLQFLSESVLLAFLAAGSSLLLLDLLHPVLENFIDRNIEVNVFQNTPFLFVMAGLVLLLGIVAGLYPAFYIASFQPMHALKNLQFGKVSKRLVINSLVVAQFVIAIILIISTTVVLLQLDFLNSKEKGFKTDQILRVDFGYGNQSKYNTLKNEWLKIAGVEDVTAAKHSLGGEIWQNGIQFKDKEGKTAHIAIPVMNADANYFNFYDIKLIKGNNFSEKATETAREYIINETLAKQIGWENPIGQAIRLSWLPEWGTVVGVVKDFNFNTLHYKISPLCVHAATPGARELSIKVNTQTIASTLQALEKVWKQQIHDRPFDYQFLDEHFATLYETESRIGRLISAAATLAIIIACLGLFGIAAFTTEQRTKEIGIRKVLGASVSSIVELLSRDFIKLVGIAILIASPIAWYAMNQWLEDFAYRINLQWWIFILAGIAATAIALLTVSFQTVRAAVANPVESLKNE